MKKITSFILAIALLCTAIPFASAETVPSCGSRFTYIGQASASLTIHESTGIASCYAMCYATNSTLTVRIVGTLQKLSNGSWSNIKSWEKSGLSYVALATSRAVISGYTYRFKANISILDSNGHVLEMTTLYDVKNYSTT